MDATIAALTGNHPGRPEPTPVMDLALDVVRLQREVLAGLPEDMPSPEPEVVAGRLAAGNSALGFHDLHIDPELYHQTWLRAVALFSTAGAISTQEMNDLLDEGESGERLMRLTEPWYEHGADESISLRSDLTPETIGVAVKPWLLAAAARVARSVRRQEWRRSYCPTCGGEPDLAVLHGGNTRSLLCSRCDTLWEWRLEGCPLCDDLDTPTRLHQGPMPGYTLLECTGCDRALKTVDAAVLGQNLVPAAERLFAAQLDHLAAELNLTS